jgi:hypothetical protein
VAPAELAVVVPDDTVVVPDFVVVGLTELEEDTPLLMYEL